MKEYIYAGFGETLLFAESLGWVEDDPNGDESRTDWGDAAESDALDFIVACGFEVIYEDDHDVGS